MKKISFLLAVFLLISVLPLATSAAEKDASLSVSSRATESGNIFIFASVTDIKSSGGISYLEYSIKYDPKVLELKNAMVNMPDTWGSDAEDWSKTVTDGEYLWSVFNIELGYAVKEDNQLFIELEFTPLTDNCVTSINFDCIEICGDDLLSPLSGKSLEFKITVAKDSDDNIIVSDSSVIDSDNKDESGNANSGQSSDDHLDDGSVSSSSASSNNDPHVGVELNGDTDSDNGIDSTAIIIVAVVLALLGAGVAAVFFIRSKKGDK